MFSSMSNHMLLIKIVSHPTLSNSKFIFINYAQYFLTPSKLNIKKQKTIIIK